MRLSLFSKLLVAFTAVVASQSAWAGPAPWASNDYVDLYFRIYNGHVPLPMLSLVRKTEMAQTATTWTVEYSTEWLIPFVRIAVP